MVARQFRVLEAASSSPATSTNRKGRGYPCLFCWSKLMGERSLQAASYFLILAYSVRLDELATGEFARHRRVRSSESRHFDETLLIRTFEIPHGLKTESVSFFFLGRRSSPIFRADSHHSLSIPAVLSERMSKIVFLIPADICATHFISSSVRRMISGASFLRFARTMA